MSVHGEFLRVLSECVEFLRTRRAPECAGWRAELERARAHHEIDLEEAAGMVLSLLESRAAAGPPRFESAAERDAFAERTDHLAAICRVIVGH